MNVRFSPRSLTVQTLLAFLLALIATAQTTTTDQSEQQPPPRAVHSHRPVVRDTTTATNPTLCASCVESNLSYLAGPTLHGRGSGTEDERHAAQFIAGKLKQYGLQPAAGDGQFVQTGTVRSREVVGNPTLSVDIKSTQPIVLTHGKQIVMAGLSQPTVSGTLQKLDLNNEKASPDDVTAGRAVLIKLKPGTTMEDARTILAPYRSGKAAIVIIASSPVAQRMFDALAKQPPQMPQQIGNEEPPKRAPLVIAKQEAFDLLWAQPEGTTLMLKANITPWKETHTWNVLGKIEGTTEKDQIILLSAHLDHLGVVKGETYPGADDDASGTAAVMELARVLANEPKPNRTVIVALWGSEEQGMMGAQYFLQYPTFTLKDIAANLEFEMIGRPDPKVKPDQLWLTGWDRTNLGPELAQHGAKLVADPHPAEKFFQRSDNYELAKEGIVAQTVSSFGLHKDYHQPTDTIAKIDFQHMDQAIASMIGPVTWLANTDFKPEWV
ncbi:MAG TPA: M20/M25/M40 family metallo-hydrolase, partial [Terriglobales bacterium]